MSPWLSEHTYINTPGFYSTYGVAKKQCTQWVWGANLSHAILVYALSFSYLLQNTENMVAEFLSSHHRCWMAILPSNYDTHLIQEKVSPKWWLNNGMLEYIAIMYWNGWGVCGTWVQHKTSWPPIGKSSKNSRLDQEKGWYLTNEKQTTKL